MKIELKVQKEFDVKYLKVSASVRYWEDSIIDGEADESGTLTPCRNDEQWCPIIEVESGKIINWKQGVKADIHHKICDCGEYSLLDEDKKEIVSIEGYVPDMMSPKEDGYGDYIIMTINEDGFIQNWKASFDEFNLIDDN